MKYFAEERIFFFAKYSFVVCTSFVIVHRGLWVISPFSVGNYGMAFRVPLACREVLWCQFRNFASPMAVPPPPPKLLKNSGALQTSVQ